MYPQRICGVTPKSILLSIRVIIWMAMEGWENDLKSYWIRWKRMESCVICISISLMSIRTVKSTILTIKLAEDGSYQYQALKDR